MLNPDLLDRTASELRRLQMKAVVVANPLRHVWNHADLTAGHGHEVLLDVLAKALDVAGDKTPDRRVADGERLGGRSGRRAKRQHADVKRRGNHERAHLLSLRIKKERRAFARRPKITFLRNTQ